MNGSPDVNTRSAGGSVPTGVYYADSQTFFQTQTFADPVQAFSRTAGAQSVKRGKYRSSGQWGLRAYLSLLFVPLTGWGGACALILGFLNSADLLKQYIEISEKTRLTAAELQILFSYSKTQLLRNTLQYGFLAVILSALCVALLVYGIWCVSKAFSSGNELKRLQNAAFTNGGGMM